MSDKPQPPGGPPPGPDAPGPLDPLATTGEGEALSPSPGVERLTQLRDQLDTLRGDPKFNALPDEHQAQTVGARLVDGENEALRLELGNDTEVQIGARVTIPVGKGRQQEATVVGAEPDPAGGNRVLPVVQWRAGQQRKPVRRSVDPSAATVAEAAPSDVARHVMGRGRAFLGLRAPTPAPGDTSSARPNSGAQPSQPRPGSRPGPTPPAPGRSTSSGGPSSGSRQPNPTGRPPSGRPSPRPQPGPGPGPSGGPPSPDGAPNRPTPGGDTTVAPGDPRNRRPGRGQRPGPGGPGRAGGGQAPPPGRGRGGRGPGPAPGPGGPPQSGGERQTGPRLLGRDDIRQHFIDVGHVDGAEADRWADQIAGDRGVRVYALRDPDGDANDPNNHRLGTVWGARREQVPGTGDVVRYAIRYDPDDPANPPDPDQVDWVPLGNFGPDDTPPPRIPGFGTRPTAVPRPQPGSVNPPPGSRRGGPGGPPPPGGPPNPPDANRPSWLRRGVGRLQTAAWKTAVPGFWLELGMEKAGWLENHPKARRAIATVGGLAVTAALTKGASAVAGDIDLPDLNLDSPVSFQSPRSGDKWQSPVEFDNPFSPDAHDRDHGGGDSTTGPADEVTDEGTSGTGGTGNNDGVEGQTPESTPEGPATEVTLPPDVDQWDVPGGWTTRNKNHYQALSEAWRDTGLPEDQVNEQLRPIFEHPNGPEAENLENFFSHVSDVRKDLNDAYLETHGAPMPRDELQQALDTRIESDFEHLRGSETGGAGATEQGEIPSPELQEAESITLDVPPGEGFENSLQEQYGLTDAQAARAYQMMRPALLEEFQARGHDSGMYMVGDDIRISNPGQFRLNAAASENLRQFLDTMRENPLDEDLPQAA